MISPSSNLIKHIVVIAILSAIIMLGIIYPFLPGEFDPLAVPVSILFQVFGLVGLPLVVIGTLWLFFPKRAYFLAATSVLFATFLILVLGLFAVLSTGKIMAIMLLAGWTVLVLIFVPKLKSLREGNVAFNPAPLYFVVLPLVSLAAQLMLADPLTNWSRDRAIAMASQQIEDLERYKSTHAHYPVTLHAQHKDYETNVVGVEKFFYAADETGYNLSFEQPRFLLDRFGTREWVVYNPIDENSMYSHATWHLPDAGRRTEGWYDSGATKHEHWRWFYFD